MIQFNMTLKDAIAAAGEEVANAPLNMTVRQFHGCVRSLVVRNQDYQYTFICVETWRGMKEKPAVIVSMSSGDSFGG